MVQRFDTDIYCNFPKYLSPIPVRILKILGFGADVLCAWDKNMRHCYMLQQSFKQSAGRLPTRGSNYQS